MARVQQLMPTIAALGVAVDAEGTPRRRLSLVAAGVSAGLTQTP